MVFLNATDPLASTHISTQIHEHACMLKLMHTHFKNFIYAIDPAFLGLNTYLEQNWYIMNEYVKKYTWSPRLNKLSKICFCVNLSLFTWQ